MLKETTLCLIESYFDIYILLKNLVQRTPHELHQQKVKNNF